MTGIHSCSHYCTRPACVLAQRDEMRDEIERLKSDIAGYIQHATDETSRVVALEVEIARLRAALEAQPAEALDVPYSVFRQGFTAIEKWKAEQAAPPAPAVPPGYALVPVEPTEDMVQAYLDANDLYWKQADELPTKLGVWRGGTPVKATIASYRAMIAAAAQPVAESSKFGRMLQAARQTPEYAEERAALAAQPAEPPVPEGYVLVPIEPTQAMCISGDIARHSFVTQARTSVIYRAMIAAAGEKP